MVEALYLAVVALLAPVFAEYAKIRVKVEQPFNLVAGAGVLFLLAAGFETALWTSVVETNYGSYLFQLIGWIFLLIGVIWAAFGLTTSKKKTK
jgi:hypothetical protein